jgi:hypothetical protein
LIICGCRHRIAGSVRRSISIKMDAPGALLNYSKLNIFISALNFALREPGVIEWLQNNSQINAVVRRWCLIVVSGSTMIDSYSLRIKKKPKDHFK